MSPIFVLPRARSRPHVLALWTVLASSLALCTVSAGAAPAPPVASAAPASAFLRVDRDPVTGTLTPAGPTSDPRLMPLWAANVRPALDRATTVRLADGSMMVDLTGIYLDFATAHREWDGHVVAECDAAWVPEVLRPIATAPALPLGGAEQ